MYPGYNSALKARAGKHRHERLLRKRRQALAKQMLYISSGPILRALKPAVRKQLAKERAPSLWTLPSDPDFCRVHRGDYPRHSLLGLPAELRQKIFFLSFDVRQILQQNVGLLGDKPRDFRVEKLHLGPERPPTGLEQTIIDKLNDRINELCQVVSIVSNDIRYVGRQWQHAIDAFTHKKIDVEAFTFPEFTTHPTPMFSRQRQKSVVIQGDDPPLKGRNQGSASTALSNMSPANLGDPGRQKIRKCGSKTQCQSAAGEPGHKQ